MMSVARASLLGLLLVVSGCTPSPVKPWQRDVLSRPEMAWEPDPLLATYRRHVHFSKEAASGDTALAGGGCGCN